LDLSEIFKTARLCLAVLLYAAQPSGLRTRSVLGGYFLSIAKGRTGRFTNSPPQLGQMPWSFASAQSAQKVHSKVQIRASSASGGRSLSQHSQLGRNASMNSSLVN